MDSAKALAALAAAAVLCSFLAAAAQPALPTAIEGRVTYANSTPAEGFVVEASWLDNSGVVRTSMTRTLTMSEAVGLGNPGLAGYYFFNQGYIQAQDGSEIVVKASGGVNSEKVHASPGSDVVPAPLLLLPDSTDKTPPSISSISVINIEDGVAISFLTSELATSAVRYGTQAPVTTAVNNTLATASLVRLSPVAAQTDYLYEVIATDASGNTATDNNNGQYYRFTTGEAGPGSGGAGASKPTPNVKGGKQSSSQAGGPYEALGGGAGEFEATPNTLPTSVYGKLIDGSGKPVENAEVVAEWSDEDGNTHTLTAETINAREAEKLGNPDLAGYYFFRSNLTLPSGTGVNITSQSVNGYQATARANPGGGSQAVVVRKPSSKVPRWRQQDRKIGQARPRETVSPAELISRLAENTVFWKRTFLAFAAVSSVLIALSLRRFLKSRAFGIGEEFGKTIRKITGKNASAFMEKGFVGIESREKLEDAARLMCEKEKGGLVVLDSGAPVGWVTERTIVQDILVSGLSASSKIKSATIIKPVIVRPDTPMSEVWRRLNSSGTTRAIVMDNGKIIGVARVSDMARELSRFLETRRFGSQIVPDMASVMSRKVARVGAEGTLKEAIDDMARNQSDCVFIPQGAEGGLAIITEKDVLDEVAIIGGRAAKVKAAAVAKSPVKSAPQYVNVFEANSMMLDEKFRRLPVIRQGEILGIATQEAVVASIMAFLSQAERRRKK